MKIAIFIVKIKKGTRIKLTLNHFFNNALTKTCLFPLKRWPSVIRVI